MNKNNLTKQLENYVVQYRESHYRLAYSYVKNPDDALDIVQEAVYKALLAIDTLKNPSQIKTWFYRILVNAALDFLRKHKRVSVVGDEIVTWIEGGQMDQYPSIDLQAALDTLPVNYRQVVVLRYFEDLKLEEIADILNENVNTVKTRLYRSLKRLRLQMDDETGEVLA